MSEEEEDITKKDAIALAVAAENELLLEKKMQMDEQKRKRSSFLADMDTFSSTFETTQQKNDRDIKLATEREAAILTEEMKKTSLSFVPVPTESFINKSPEVAPVSVSEETSKYDFESKEDVEVLTVTTTTTTTATNNHLYTGISIPLGKSDDVNFNELASSLFATANNKIISTESIKSTTIDNSDSSSDSLRMITKFGASDKYNNISLDDEDNAEEGTGEIDSLSNILTKDERLNLSASEKASWRALQGDLTARRKDFHGAVTLAFDGIFSWQMYGSADAIDETGKAYTEYLMRCQYGTTWDNLQPWITARRYREFDQLDTQLRKYYPNLAKSLIPLPEKDFFNFLESSVVEKRRLALEEYMYAIIVKLPSILRSDIFNDFMSIHTRVTSIRNKLIGTNSNQMISSTPASQSDVAINASSSGSSSVINSDGINNLQAIELMLSNENNELIVTIESAEAAREKDGSMPLNEDQLGRMEESVRDFNYTLRQANIRDLHPNSKLIQLLRDCTSIWPNLRATTAVGADINFSLIPRAMQTEEDLVKGIDELRSFVLASKLT